MRDNEPTPTRCGHHDVIISREALHFVAGSDASERSGQTQERLVDFVRSRLEDAGMKEGDLFSVRMDEDRIHFHGPFTDEEKRDILKSSLDKFREGWERIFGLDDDDA